MYFTNVFAAALRLAGWLLPLLPLGATTKTNLQKKAACAAFLPDGVSR